MTEDKQPRGLFPVVMLAWLTMMGVDFLLHGGVLARFYAATDPFLLPAADAFRRIPLGYAGFLLMAFLLVWLMRRLAIRGWRDGLTFGFQLGALVWGALALGLYSISTASVGLLAAWFVGQSIELGVAGAFVGSAFRGKQLKKLFWAAIALILVCAVATIALQSLGLAPAMRSR